MARSLESFNFSPGKKVGARFVIESLLGRGTEGEVYRISELDTGISRAAKFYFPHRDLKRRASIKHAHKLNALRHCPIVLQYHHSEIVRVRDDKIIALISDLCEGKQLEEWIARHRGKRLKPYLALHVLYNLVRGIEAIHAVGQYHGDVHSQNILIQPRGVKFELKLIDFYDWGRPAPFKRKQDITDSLTVFGECLGGRDRLPELPEEIRFICSGLRYDVMLRRFPTMTNLRQHLEQFEWASTL